MTAIPVDQPLAREHGEARPQVSHGLADWLTTTDHKQIGLLYIGTSLVFFLLGGLAALALRLELAQPGMEFVTPEVYDQLFTMHGTIMMFLFGTPIALGLANYLLPLQIGAADMAFPRLNALSYWLFLFGGLVVVGGTFIVGGPADAGWTIYAPLSGPDYSPGPAMDMWIVGIGLTGISSILGAVNFIATLFTRRAPGMTMLRVPIFTWGVLVTAVLILFSFPVLTAALALLYIDRHLGGSFFEAASGGSPVLFQHLFWFFGHPEVYILILPFFGIISEIVPVFSRKPLFGYRAMILSLVLIALYSFTVWAHHMFTTGAVDLPFFSFVSLLIAVPTGIKFFNWIATMWRGQLTFPTPMLWCLGMMYFFLIGGITGVIVASPPLDFQFQDTYFVVAHLHNVLVGGTVLAAFAAIYFWFPKATGRLLSERLGKIHFWTFLVGITVTFLPQYQLGADGMPRRYADYPPNPGWADLNMISTVGSWIMAFSILVFLVNVVLTLRRPATAPDDPWEANSLEWATSSPPPDHNFRSLPKVRSERPVFDMRMSANQERSDA
ncbi:MAG TPA: cytochrome c oxidase subunit I [Candidatus Limnocylindrales bacterium]